MTKQGLKNKVGMGFFSVRWFKNNGSEANIHRCILGTNKKIEGQHKEYDNYVLVYKVGNGYQSEHSKWANVNPNTVIAINGGAV